MRHVGVGLAYYNSLRTGDTTPSITGALTFSFYDGKVEPTVEPVWILAANARTPPPAVGGRARVSSFNVLNFFNNGPQFNNGTSNDRGATTAVEFDRQRAKIANAITTISPDVLGLTEVSNAQ